MMPLYAVILSYRTQLSTRTVIHAQSVQSATFKSASTRSYLLQTACRKDELRDLHGGDQLLLHKDSSPYFQGLISCVPMCSQSRRHALRWPRLHLLPYQTQPLGLRPSIAIQIGCLYHIPSCRLIGARFELL